jgi:DNA-binding IclR family transcriptional regulator
VLRSFAKKDEWGVRELAAHLDIPKSAAHRTLQELAQIRVLRARPDGTYVATGGLVQLAALLMQAFDLPRLAMPHLTKLRDETGETALLNLFEPELRQFASVAACESRHVIRYVYLAGWGPIHVGASGLGILAFLPDEDQRSIIASLPDPVHEGMSKAKLKRELGATRRRGWAKSAGNPYPRMCAVAAPLRGTTGEVLGDIVVSWPNVDGAVKASERAGPLCASVADQLSRDLGWTG